MDKKERNKARLLDAYFWYRGIGIQHDEAVKMAIAENS